MLPDIPQCLWYVAWMICIVFILQHHKGIKYCLHYKPPPPKKGMITYTSSKIVRDFVQKLICSYPQPDLLVVDSDLHPVNQSVSHRAVKRHRDLKESPRCLGGQPLPQPSGTLEDEGIEPYSHHPFGKENDLNQTSMILFHVDPQGCNFPIRVTNCCCQRRCFRCICCVQFRPEWPFLAGRTMESRCNESSYYVIVYIQLQTPNFALLHQVSFMVTQVMKSTIKPDLTVSQNGHKMYFYSTDPRIQISSPLNILISWINFFPSFSSCWFQPIWQMLVKLDDFPKYLKPPPSFPW